MSVEEHQEIGWGSIMDVLECLVESYGGLFRDLKWGVT